MAKPLIVVESPTKVRTIKKYLGKVYNVAATVGHVKDLPQKEMGIDIDGGFKPKYITIPGKQKVISELRRAAGDTKDIYLAADPDREGEAIAWHTSEILKKKGRKFHRVLFHELTKNAIEDALTHPQDLNRSKYEAQQARRILDRLVGYQISPLLWRKVKGGRCAEMPGKNSHSSTRRFPSRRKGQVHRKRRERVGAEDSGRAARSCFRVL